MMGSEWGETTLTSTDTTLNRLDCYKHQLPQAIAIRELVWGDVGILIILLITWAK